MTHLDAEYAHSVLLCRKYLYDALTLTQSHHPLSCVSAMPIHFFVLNFTHFLCVYFAFTICCQFSFLPTRHMAAPSATFQCIRCWQLCHFLLANNNTDFWHYVYPYCIWLCVYLWRVNVCYTDSRTRVVATVPAVTFFLYCPLRKS